MALSVLGVILPPGVHRLPRKVAAPLAGRPLVAWVFDAARKGPRPRRRGGGDRRHEVMEVCGNLGIPAVPSVGPIIPRAPIAMWESRRHAPLDVYVNIQGDEPFVTAGHIAKLVEPFRRDAARR
jgi:3-deoxy-manno-octulosonate cytidylyltransferase (CMP-KDO synthetase)